MRRTATRRRPRMRVEVEGASGEREEKKVVFRFFWRTSCRKGGDGAGEDDREGGGRERERRMVTARMRETLGEGGAGERAETTVGEAADAWD
jgi:hypothetical protein